MDDTNLENKIEQAVIRAFSAGVGEKRYIDVSRIPLICQSINQIGEDISEIKDNMNTSVTQDQFWPVKTLVYGITGLMLTGIVGALLMLLLKH